MFCINCGAECPNQAKFCANCGQNLVGINDTDSKETLENATEELQKAKETISIPKRAKPIGKIALFGVIILTALSVAAIVLFMIFFKKNDDNAQKIYNVSASEFVFIAYDKLYERNGIVEDGVKDVIYEEDDILLDGTYIESADAQIEENPLSGDKVGYMVSVKFNKEGMKIFRKITGDMAPSQEPLCVLYCHRLISSPRVTSEIKDGKAVISGLQSLEEAEEIAAVLSKQKGGHKTERRAIDMDAAFKLFMVIGCGAFAVYLVYLFQRDKRLFNSGKIIYRKRKFAEEAEEFILTLTDSSLVAKKLRKLSYQEMKVVMNSKGDQEFFFSNSRCRWKARLFLKGSEGEKVIYCFEFLNWQVNNGAPIGDLYMNMLLTAVEKVFLSLDPHTEVKMRLLETTTKHNIL